MGGIFESRSAAWRGLRAVLVTAATAVLALVVLPTGASADPRVPPAACPPDVTLQGIERAPGGVILVGRVASVTPEVGRVRMSISSWYHRSWIPGLAPGDHPATIDVMLGPRLNNTGPEALPHQPGVGSRYLVAGAWTRPIRGVSVACGVFANVETPIGAAWLDLAEAHYSAIPPNAEAGPPALPVQAPWFVLGAGAAVLLMVAMILGAVAQSLDPAPAV
jgi:hypothetical protein